VPNRGRLPEWSLGLCRPGIPVVLQMPEMNVGIGDWQRGQSSGRRTRRILVDREDAPIAPHGEPEADRDRRLLSSHSAAAAEFPSKSIVPVDERTDGRRLIEPYHEIFGSVTKQLSGVRLPMLQTGPLLPEGHHDLDVVGEQVEQRRPVSCERAGVPSRSRSTHYAANVFFLATRVRTSMPAQGSIAATCRSPLLLHRTATQESA
jgi:hypothetical protein